jgi:hypothetical protein
MSERTSVIAPAAALYSAMALTRAAKVCATPTETRVLSRRRYRDGWRGGDGSGRSDLGADTGNGVGTDLDVGHEYPLHGR